MQRFRFGGQVTVLGLSVVFFSLSMPFRVIRLPPRVSDEASIDPISAPTKTNIRETDLRPTEAGLNRSDLLDEAYLETQTTYDLERNSTNIHRLWLHVDDVTEGMANWRVAFVELLLTAQSIGAAFVEPCIFRGRVTSCHKYHTLRMSEVYDLKMLQNRIYPAFVSQRDYQNEVGFSKSSTAKVFAFCMHHGNPSPAVLCLRQSEILPNFYQVEANSVLDQALKYHQENPNEHVVLEIQTYRRGGFLKTQSNGKRLVDTKVLASVLKNDLSFLQFHYETVGEFLRILNLTEGAYNVVHWRAELPRLNYNDCATKLVQAKALLSPDNRSTFLISSLNQMSGLQWGGMPAWKYGPALQKLLNSGFLKLETLKSKPIKDMAGLAIWDQILAEKAAQFATCTKACGDNHPCSTCNYRGSFGEAVMDLRQRAGKQSLSCWPTK
jgi:hypothetical protein